MSTTASPAPMPSPASPSTRAPGRAKPANSANRAGRILAVLRLHFANPGTIIGMPATVYSIIFVINWFVWLIVDLTNSNNSDLQSVDQASSWSGASMFIFVWLLILAVQAMNRTFHFALGFGATRRDYYLGTILVLVATCAGWAIVFGILAIIEEASNGWGVHDHMFSSIYFGDNGSLARFWYVFLLMLFFAGLGLIAGTLFVRWRTWGLIAFLSVLAVLLVGTGAWIALTNNWVQFGHFFTGLGFAGAYPLLLIPTAVAGMLGYVALRRAPARA